ncbi:MAG: hypothetical protein RL198_138 [Actinomycetota bacterium]
MLLPVLPVSATAFGLDLAGAGALLALILIGSLLAELPSARVIARIGERKALITAGLAFGGFALLPAFQLGLWVLFLSAIGIGVTLALSGLARHSLMTSYVPANQRARALATLGGMFRTGWTAGPLLGSLMIGLFGLPASYVAAAVLATASAVVLASYPQFKLRVERTVSADGVWRVARANRKALLTLGTAAGILQAARVIRLVGLPLLAVHLGLEPALAAFIIGAASLIDVLLFPIGGWLMDRFGRIWGSVPTLLLLGFTYAFTPFIAGAEGFAIIATLAALANSISSGVNMVLGSDLAPAESRAEFLASFRLMTSVGTTLSPISLSLVTALTGVPVAMALVGSLNFIGVWLFTRYLPKFGLSKPRIDG